MKQLQFDFQDILSTTDLSPYFAGTGYKFDTDKEIHVGDWVKTVRKEYYELFHEEVPHGYYYDGEPGTITRTREVVEIGRIVLAPMIVAEYVSVDGNLIPTSGKRDIESFRNITLLKEAP